uniref:Uncharacterized protein n=1 Tax=Rhizophora mucronata TaxID=61149 RepID=A0A2P2PRL9_RHIMU
MSENERTAAVTASYFTVSSPIVRETRLFFNYHGAVEILTYSSSFSRNSTGNCRFLRILTSTTKHLNVL